jgi:hypothetical protein
MRKYYEQGWIQHQRIINNRDFVDTVVDGIRDVVVGKNSCRKKENLLPKMLVLILASFSRPLGLTSPSE